MHSYTLENVDKHYKQGSTAVRAVDDVSLTIEQGELVAVTGPSGSGKSTMLQLLGALDRPTSGSLRFEDEDLASLPDRRLADLRLHAFGFVFQQFNLIPTLTAAENVEAALAPTHMERRARRDRCSELLDKVGLGGRVQHLPGQLSGGEQQRVAIARALANEPRVILADEPTGNLDSTNGASILDLLVDLAGQNDATMILVTHDAQVAARAPRIVRMQDGRIDSDGTAAPPYQSSGSFS
jgi:putative ABC transport system ATP-binding protein